MWKQDIRYIRRPLIALLVAGMFITLKGGLRAAAAFSAPSDPPSIANVFRVQPNSADGILRVSAGPASSAADPQIDPASALIGTVVVDGGRSVAVFDLPGGQRLVRVGDEIVDGVRLLQVRRNQIEIQRGGVTQEIGLGSVASAVMTYDDAVGNVNRLLEFRRQKIEDLNRFRARSVGR